jgi:putative addiction module killer protein
MIPKIDIQIYRTKTGKVAFSDWLRKLDKSTQAIIDTRIARVRGGNFGDCKRLSGANGLFELRINFGPGFRI